MKIGDPFDRSVAHGPQNHEKHLLKLLSYCKTGQEQGARLVYGGKRHGDKGKLTDHVCIGACPDHCLPPVGIPTLFSVTNALSTVLSPTHFSCLVLYVL